MTHEERARRWVADHEHASCGHPHAFMSQKPCEHCLTLLRTNLAAAFAEVEREALERAAEVAHKQAVAYARYHATAGERGREIRKEKAGMAKQIEAAIRALAAEER